jgi:predicted nucleic acid-binding protein
VIAYDTNILIYAFEGTSPWAAAAQEVVRQGEREGAVLSVLAWQELLTGAALKGYGADDQLMRSLRDLTATRFVPVMQEICKRAVLLTAQYGRQVYGYDAIHLATALTHGATAFVTNDKALLSVLSVDDLEIRAL